MIEIVVPQTPVGKGRARFVKATGRTYTPQKTVAFEGLVALAGQEAMAGAAPLDGPMTLLIDAYFPIPKSRPKKWQAAARAGAVRPTGKPDGDNVMKAVGDALNTIVWVDDSQIVDARVRKLYSDTPRTVIRVTIIDEHGEPPRGDIFG